MGLGGAKYGGFRVQNVMITRITNSMIWTLWNSCWTQDLLRCGTNTCMQG